MRRPAAVRDAVGSRPAAQRERRMDGRAAFLAALRRYRAETPRDRGFRDETARLVREAPDPFGRDPMRDHVTASAFVVDRAGTHALLTEHRKLGRWLQLGGHCDGESDPLAAALREAREESGLGRIDVVSPEILDIDIHVIPARGAEPSHRHLDTRYLLAADRDAPLSLSAESTRLAWVPLADLAAWAPSPSVLVLRDKLAAAVRR